MSLFQISTMIGFVSSSHFSKCYKAFFGHAPKYERRIVAATPIREVVH